MHSTAKHPQAHSHMHSGKHAPPAAKVYNPRHPEQTLLYRTAAERFDTPARGPPLWDDCDAQAGEGVDVEPDGDISAQIALEYQVDQRINW